MLLSLCVPFSSAGTSPILVSLMVLTYTLASEGFTFDLICLSTSAAYLSLAAGFRSTASRRDLRFFLVVALLSDTHDAN